MSKDYIAEAVTRLSAVLNRNRSSAHVKALESDMVFEWLSENIGFDEAKAAWKSVVEGAEGK